MLRAGELSLVASVLAVVRERKPLAEVAGWRDAADQRVSDLATLLTIETGQLDERAVGALPRLLADADDLVRMRTALAIAVVSRGSPGRPAHRASLLGAATLASLTRLTDSALSPRLGTDLWWGLSDIEHDSAETLRGALDILAAEPEIRLLLLSSIRQPTAQVLVELVQLAADLSEPEQLALLDSVEAIADSPERAGLRGLARLAAPLRALAPGVTEPVLARVWTLLGQAEPASEAAVREFTRRAAGGQGAIQLSGDVLGAVEGLGYLLQRMPAPADSPSVAAARADAIRVLRTLVTATDLELAVLAATALYRAGDHDYLAAELGAGRADALVLVYGLTGCLNAKRLIGPEYYDLVDQVCQFVREPPGLTGRDAEQHTSRLLAVLLERAADELRAAPRPVRRGSRLRHLPGLASLLSVLAELAAMQPAAMRVAAKEHPLLGARLAAAAASDEWLVRQHAARLMILLGNGDERSMLALLDTALDTDVVRRAVLADIVWFDSITPDSFGLLLAAAEDPRPGRSYLAVQLLSVLLARSMLPDTEHMAALAAIQRATTAPGADQPLLAEHAGEIRNMGSVAEAGRQILVELAAGDLPVAEAFGAPQFRLRLPDSAQSPMEFVVSRHPVKPQAITNAQVTYFRDFEQRRVIQFDIINALDAAAEAAMAPGIALDELLGQSGGVSPAAAHSLAQTRGRTAPQS